MYSQPLFLFENSIGGLNCEAQGQPRFYADLAFIEETVLHHHDYAEIAFYIDGNGSEWVNSQSTDIAAGMVTFILPHYIHAVKCQDGKPMRKYRMMFDLEILYGADGNSELVRLISNLRSSQYTWVMLDARTRRRMASICNSLLKEFESGHDPERDIMIRTKLTEALLVFSRAARQKVADASFEPLEHHTEMSTIKLILQYVHAHYTDDLTLGSTSELFHVSASYISRLFKKFTGKGFLEYVHFLRVERAATLLCHTQNSITDIAYEVGFGSLRTFTRVFCKCIGLSASEYRTHYPEVPRKWAR